jgi:hypothetical protein
MDLVTIIDPRSVLDVGAGFGKYGMLCREYLELWDGREQYSNFKRRIDCVEAYGPYITSLHRFVYDNLYVQDVQELVDNLDYSYDLVLLIDVLEHFSKKDGEHLLRKILSKHKGTLISTPKDPSDQRDAFGNTYEIHQSRWTKKNLTNLKNIQKGNFIRSYGSAKIGNGIKDKISCYFIRDPVSNIGYIGSSDLVHKLKRKQFIRKVSKVPFMKTSLRIFVRLTKPIYK